MRHESYGRRTIEVAVCVASLTPYPQRVLDPYSTCTTGSLTGDTTGRHVPVATQLHLTPWLAMRGPVCECPLFPLTV
jgi:hypothetical protein